MLRKDPDQLKPLIRFNMPYERKGKTIMSKSGGSWHTKQTASTVANAIKAMRLLQGIEHGMIPNKDKNKPNPNE